jgi:hypothetical protein
MPKSQFIDSRRVRPLLLYCTVAFLVLLLADAALQAFGGEGARMFVVLAWLVLFPAGGWMVWTRT